MLWATYVEADHNISGCSLEKEGCSKFCISVSLFKSLYHSIPRKPRSISCLIVCSGNVLPVAVVAPAVLLPVGVGPIPVLGASAGTAPVVVVELN